MPCTWGPSFPRTRNYFSSVYKYRGLAERTARPIQSNTHKHFQQPLPSVATTTQPQPCARRTTFPYPTVPMATPTAPMARPRTRSLLFVVPIDGFASILPMARPLTVLGADPRGEPVCAGPRCAIKRLQLQDHRVDASRGRAVCQRLVRHWFVTCCTASPSRGIWRLTVRCVVLETKIKMCVIARCLDSVLAWLTLSQR